MVSMDLRWFFGESSVSALLSCPVTILFSLLPGVIQHSHSPRDTRSSNHWSWAFLALAKVKDVEPLDEFDSLEKQL